MNISLECKATFGDDEEFEIGYLELKTIEDIRNRLKHFEEALILRLTTYRRENENLD